jgi:hypothetical protein
VRRQRTGVALAVALGVALLAPATARAAGADAEPATEPGVHPSALWLATQLLPSVGLAAGEGGARFGMLWQVTPLLYSWGIHRRLSPWRALVVEPNVRHSGSVELFVSPEVYFGAGGFALLRPGLRAYFPLVEHGERLSVSLGSSYQSVPGAPSAALEVGAYTLFGILGAQLTYAPAPHQPLSALATLRLRYF